MGQERGFDPLRNPFWQPPPDRIPTARVPPLNDHGVSFNLHIPSAKEILAPVCRRLRQQAAEQQQKMIQQDKEDMEDSGHRFTTKYNFDKDEWSTWDREKHRFTK